MRTISGRDIGTSLSFSELLRVLQEKKVRAWGSNTFLPIDVRIVARKQGLERLIRAGHSEDLYYRLSVVTIRCFSRRAGGRHPLSCSISGAFQSTQQTPCRYQRSGGQVLGSIELPGNVVSSKTDRAACDFSARTNLAEEVESSGSRSRHVAPENRALRGSCRT